VMPLWVADMDLPTSHAIQEALSKRIAHPIFGYHHYHAKYLQSIKHWMLQQHTWEVAIKEISPINSIVSALMLAVETFSDKGEGVLIQTPIYPPFMHAVKHQHRKILDNTLTLKTLKKKPKRQNSFYFVLHTTLLDVSKNKKS